MRLSPGAAFQGISASLSVFVEGRLPGPAPVGRDPGLPGADLPPGPELCPAAVLCSGAGPEHPGSRRLWGLSGCVPALSPGPQCQASTFALFTFFWKQPALSDGLSSK